MTIQTDIHPATAAFYKGKNVFITGNTGFKGTWLTRMLLDTGANVTGYSLPAPTDPNLFSILGLDGEKALRQVTGDVRDLAKLTDAMRQAQPEIVFHLAAQPIVRDAFRDPVSTYEINVMGTVNICEAVRQTESVRSFLNVTTDKVYRNDERAEGYQETDYLDGHDPYSNSKSCSELVTHSYADSFFADGRVAVSTARAGNVIGGGDFSNDRIIPDCVRAILRAVETGEEAVIGVRNPHSTRPYQHVSEPLSVYLMIAMKQYEDRSFAGCYNVGPDDEDCITTGDLVTRFCETWNALKGDGMPALAWENRAEENAPPEANFLKLDNSLLKKTFGWQPAMHINQAIEEIVRFTDAFARTKLK